MKPIIDIYIDKKESGFHKQTSFFRIYLQEKNS